MSTVIKAYKGFDKDMKCRDFQFEVGKEYHHDGSVKPCSSGFHGCKNPADVWSYYAPGFSRYAEVELFGTTKDHSEDSKIAASDIRIVREIAADDFFKLVLQSVFKDAEASKNISSGHSNKAASSGDSSKAAADGKNTIAMAAGLNCAASAGENGCFALCYFDKQANRNRIVAGYVGEDGIEPNVLYRLDNDGKIVKA